MSSTLNNASASCLKSALLLNKPASSPKTSGLLLSVNAIQLARKSVSGAQVNKAGRRKLAGVFAATKENALKVIVMTLQGVAAILLKQSSALSKKLRVIKRVKRKPGLLMNVLATIIAM